MSKEYNIVKVCDCGYDLNHYQIEKVDIYNWWKWGFLIMGVSVKPYLFRFQCAVCRKILGTETF